MINNKFFTKKTISNKVLAGGPPADEQLLAIANNKYWMVLNSDLLNDKRAKNGLLCDKANALKHALQTYGPNNDNLPDVRPNTGKAQGHVFHGHVSDDNGCTYVLEWTTIDTKDACSVRLLNSEPVNTDINQVISLKEILIIEMDNGYQLGFCNKTGDYEQKKIKNTGINGFLENYKAPGYIINPDHKQAIYKLLTSVEGRVFGERVIALIGFKTHENYPFRQKPLSKIECSRILFMPENIQLVHRALNKITEAKAKVERIKQSHPHLRIGGQGISP